MTVGAPDPAAMLALTRSIAARRARPGRRPRLRLQVEPRDLWVGLYWDRRSDGLHLYVCPLPALLLHVHLPGRGGALP